MVALLDDPLEWDSFGRPAGVRPSHAEAIDPQQVPLWESHVVLGGMHCTTCALTFEEALRQMRAVLGESAVVVRTTQVREGGLFGWFGEPLVEITAAGESPPAKTP